jgi:hypothetical protein
MQTAIDNAVDLARNKVRMHKPLEGGAKHTTCSALFLNNKTGQDGFYFANTTIYRNGTGMVINGWEPCAPGPNNAALFLTTTNHSPYVFVCNSFLVFAPPDNAFHLIHEWLHRAGQLEEGTDTTAGPGDPPTTQLISAIVEEACDDPQVIE